MTVDCFQRTSVLFDLLPIKIDNPQFRYAGSGVGGQFRRLVEQQCGVGDFYNQ